MPTDPDGALRVRFSELVIGRRDAAAVAAFWQQASGGSRRDDVTRVVRADSEGNEFCVLRGAPS